MTKKQLVEGVLNLPPQQRAKLARDIIASLDGPSDADAPKAWAREIERRVQEIRSGSVKLVAWRDVRKRITRRLASRA